MESYSYQHIRSTPADYAEFAAAFDLPTMAVPIAVVAPTVAPVAVARVPDWLRSTIALLPDWLRARILWLCRHLLRVADFCRALGEAVGLLPPRPLASAPARASVATLPTRTVVPAAQTARRAVSLPSPPPPTSAPSANPALRPDDSVAPTIAPAAIARLTSLAATVPSLARDPMSSDRLRGIVGEVTQSLGEIDRTDVPTVFRALRAVELIGTSGIDPLGTVYEAAAMAWSGPVWPRTRSGGLQELLTLATSQMYAALARGDAPCARMFAGLLGAVAPAHHPDVAVRLIWFADSVATPLAEAGIDGAAVRDPLTAWVGRWFEELRDASTCSVTDVVLTWWSAPMDACTHGTAIEQWVTGARRHATNRADRERSSPRPALADA